MKTKVKPSLQDRRENTILLNLIGVRRMEGLKALSVDDKSAEKLKTIVRQN